MKGIKNIKSQLNAISRCSINFGEDADDYLLHWVLLASAYFLFGVVKHFKTLVHSDHVGHTLRTIYRTVQQ